MEGVFSDIEYSDSWLASLECSQDFYRNSQRTIGETAYSGFATYRTQVHAEGADRATPWRPALVDVP